MTRSQRAWIASTLLLTIYLGGFAIAGALMTVTIDDVTYHGWIAAVVAAAIAAAPLVAGGLLVCLIVWVISWIEAGY